MSLKEKAISQRNKHIRFEENMIRQEREREIERDREGERERGGGGSRKEDVNISRILQGCRRFKPSLQLTLN